MRRPSALIDSRLTHSDGRYAGHPEQPSVPINQHDLAITLAIFAYQVQSLNHSVGLLVVFEVLLFAGPALFGWLGLSKRLLIATHLPPHTP